MNNLVPIWLPDPAFPEVTEQRIREWFEKEKVHKEGYVSNTLALWTRAKHWEHPLKNQFLFNSETHEIIGCHLATWNVRNPYINSYLLYITAAFKGNRLGGYLVDWAIQTAYSQPKPQSRWKNIAYDCNEGYAFYLGLGITPVAMKRYKATKKCPEYKAYYFDFEITGCRNLQDLIDKVQQGADINTAPEAKVVEHYKSLDEFYGKY